MNIDFTKLVEKYSHELFLLIGAKPSIGVELEFYLSPSSLPHHPLLDALAKKCLRVEKEKGENQYECVLAHSQDLLGLIAQITDLKYGIVEQAKQYGMQAIFAAKPYAHDYGSALHMHLSLHNQANDNLFSIGNIDDNELMQSAIAGILDLSSENMHLLCPNEEDYLRFVGQFMAPTQICWGGNNRSTLIRIPDSLPQNRRIEYRAAPANADPQILMALMLIGAYHGMRNKLQAPARIWGNAFDPQYNLPSLPMSAQQAQEVYQERRVLVGYLQNFPPEN
jgi:glutamine synthetase